MLNTIENGAPGERPPLLIVHGLYGSARNWNVIAKRLSEECQVLSVDMRNHGESGFFASNSYADMAGDLAEVIEEHGGKADLLGHSMGGKASMMLALTRPELVNRLLVADISPVNYGHSQSHLITAMRRVDPITIASRREADELLQADVAEPGVRAFLLQSLDLKGRRWRLNHDVLEAYMDEITGWPEVAGRFEGPVLMLAGALSDYVLAEHREAIRDYFPKARFARIPGAGHWLHADKPREFEAAARAFFDA